LRAQFGTGNSQKFFAELPICYVYTTGQDSTNSSDPYIANYRVKVRPKTGYSYVVYDEDGTHPDYGKSNIFEIVFEKFINGYYIE